MHREGVGTEGSFFVWCVSKNSWGVPSDYTYIYCNLQRYARLRLWISRQPMQILQPQQLPPCMLLRQYFSRPNVDTIEAQCSAAWEDQQVSFLAKVSHLYYTIAAACTCWLSICRFIVCSWKMSTKINGEYTSLAHTCPLKLSAKSQAVPHEALGFEEFSKVCPAWVKYDKTSCSINRISTSLHLLCTSNCVTKDLFWGGYGKQMSHELKCFKHNHCRVCAL